MKTKTKLISNLNALFMYLCVFFAGQLYAQNITNFTLVDTDSGSDLTELVDRKIINLAQLSDINVRANTEGDVGSVVFYIDGNRFRTESAAPYALAGDASGDYFPWNVTAGLRTITAEVYSESGGNGTLLSTETILLTIRDNPDEIFILDLTLDNCPTRTLEVGDVVDLDITLFPANVTRDFVSFNSNDGISIDTTNGTFTANAPGEYRITATSFSDGTVSDSCTIIVNEPPVAEITSFTLIDVNTQSDLIELVNRKVINLAQLSDINLRANVEGDIGSVVFYVDGNRFRTESAAPYALAGDASGDYFPWNVTAGLRTVTAEVYSESGGNGILLSTETILLTIRDNPDEIFILDLTLDNCPTTALEVGDIVDLDVTLFPTNVTRDFVSFSSNDGISIDTASGTFTANAPGEYQITATSFSDGVVSDTCTIIVNQPSAENKTASNDTAFKTKMFPNPVIDVLTIELDTDNQNNVRLFDLSGAKLMETNSFDDIMELDLTTIPSGMYILEIRQQREVHRTKIVKK